MQTEVKAQKQQADHSGKKAQTIAMTSATFFQGTFLEEINKRCRVHACYSQ